jgi:hypothetical protein
MTHINIQPIKFIKKGTELEVRFLGDDDKYKWYTGIVHEINYYGEDISAKFINCQILYEDGEVVNDANFYNDNFNDEDNIDAWRFVGNISMLISFIIKNTNEINNLKDELIKDRLIEFRHDCIHEDEDDDDEIEYYEEVNKKCIMIVFLPLYRFMSHIVFVLPLAYGLYLFFEKIKK